jgi:protein-S-isoprenylcysteine O-methyltransferase Ste14
MLLQWLVLPWSMPGGTPVAVVGVVLTVAGIAFSLAAAATALRQRTTLAPHHPVARLVTTGPFRISRNPMYTGLTVGLLVGPALWMGSWWPLVFVPVCAVIILRLVIVPEETYLSERFGDEYAGYCAAVRRWL